ncbi:MAG: putative glycoside hydrolase [Chloroflexota bacterium]
MKIGTDNPIETEVVRTPFRRLLLVVALVVVIAGALFAAYRLGLFGSFIDRSLRAVQTSSANQPLVIPGMPVCAPDSGPTATARVVPPPISSFFGLAWFHKPPEEGTSAAEIAANHSYIHLTGASDIPFRDDLREAGYKGPILTYVTMNSVEGPGPYRDSAAACDNEYQGYDNQVAFYKGDFCTYIHGNESWFLHNGKGERIVDDYFGSDRWSYLMNPADPGWRAFSYERLKFIKETWYYEGLWLDNLDLDLSRAWREVTNSDGFVKEYETGEQWQAAVTGWLSGLRAEVGYGYPVWANIVGGGMSATAWDPYAPYLDGAMDESFAVRWVDDWRSPEQWQGQIQRAQRWLGLGKGLVMVGQGPQEDKERLNFTLASYMLVSDGENASFRYTRFDSYYSSLWLYPEYDVAHSLGSCREVTPGIWRREFEHGYVEVDVVQHIGRLVLQK